MLFTLWICKCTDLNCDTLINEALLLWNPPFRLYCSLSRVHASHCRWDWLLNLLCCKQTLFVLCSWTGKNLCFLPSKTVQIILFFLSFPFAAAAQALVICSVSFTYLSFSFYKIKLSLSKSLFTLFQLIFVLCPNILPCSRPNRLLQTCPCMFSAKISLVWLVFLYSNTSRFFWLCGRCWSLTQQKPLTFVTFQHC